MDVKVSGWLPRWAPAGRMIQAAHDLLTGLHGRRIVGTWLVWNLELDCWFEDLPVVVQFDDGHQLEVCWQKFDELSLTWDTIDVKVIPRAWVTWPLTWRCGGHPALDGVQGRLITAVAVTAHRFATSRLSSEGPDATEVWMTSGLWLGLAEQGLFIFNALDENGLDDRLPPPGSDHRVRWLSAGTTAGRS